MLLITLLIGSVSCSCRLSHWIKSKLSIKAMTLPTQWHQIRLLNTPYKWTSHLLAPWARWAGRLAFDQLWPRKKKISTYTDTKLEGCKCKYHLAFPPYLQKKIIIAAHEYYCPSYHIIIKVTVLKKLLTLCSLRPNKNSTLDR